MLQQHSYGWSTSGRIGTCALGVGLHAASREPKLRAPEQPMMDQMIVYAYVYVPKWAPHVLPGAIEGR